MPQQQWENTLPTGLLSLVHETIMPTGSRKKRVTKITAPPSATVPKWKRMVCQNALHMAHRGSFLPVEVSPRKYHKDVAFDIINCDIPKMT
mmetsp:Transcript_119670/g.343779  ORF Transcript_119670/g.343779 Transcript_119670/m.343779 type:complete len:91 (-) Transcript_119670:1124-1396(-)